MLGLGLRVRCYGKIVVKNDGKNFCYKIFLFKTFLEEKYLCLKIFVLKNSKMCF